MNFKPFLLLGLFLAQFLSASHAATILVYHHVNTNTPASTTISPEQFKKHLDFLKDNDFNVVALNVIVDSIKQQTPLPDKTVAITFDDGYSDIYHNAHPLLKAYNFPYTLFINPAVVPSKTGRFLDWADLTAMSEDGVMIANHGLEHQSLIKVPKGEDSKAWVDNRLAELEQAQGILNDKLNQNWRYYALPYGEYSKYALDSLAELDYVVFTQQSGAVGLNTELTAIPRFPASKPYDKLATLKTKLLSLPMTVSKQTQLREPLVLAERTQPLTEQLSVSADDFYPKMLQCFVSNGVGSELVWQDKQNVKLTLEKTLTPGRTRANCTAPSIKHNGRFYWYSIPWFVPKADGSWYTW